jgi:hypothetical protein
MSTLNREAIDRAADALALDLLDQREEDGGGVFYPLPYDDDYPAALAFVRELIVTLVERGRVLAVEAIQGESGSGLVIKDVTA